LLNVVAVALVYGFARDFFGRGVALVALALVAVNPWAVVLSRRLWGDDMVAPFAVLSLWMLSRWLFRNDGKAIVVGSVALAVVSQVYIVGLECLVAAAVAVVMAGRRLFTRWVMIGLVAFLALVAPYVFSAVAPNFGALTKLNRQPDKVAVLDVSSVQFALELASNEGYQSFALQGGSHLDATSGFLGGLGMLERALYLLGLAVGVWTMIRGPGRIDGERRGVHVLLIVAVMTPSIALVRHAVPVYPYYLVSSFPAPYLYSAIGVERLWTWSQAIAPYARKVTKSAIATILLTLFVSNLALAWVFFSVIDQYWVDGNYGMPWRMVDALANETMRLQVDLHDARVLVPEHTEEPNVLYRVLVQRGADATAFDDRAMLVLPAEGGLFVVMGDEPAQRLLARDYRQYEVKEERLDGDGTVVRFYHVPPTAASATIPSSTAPLNWTLGGILRLDGAALTSRLVPGTTAQVTVFSRPLMAPSSTTPNFSVFAHLVRSDGQSVAQRDEPAWETRRWRPGDRVIQWLNLDVPAEVAPGVLALSLGMYSLGTVDHPGVVPLEITDAHGANLGPRASGLRTLVAPLPPAPPSHPLNVVFAQGVGLDGYDLVREGSSLTVTLHWAPSAPLARDYTAFVHVLDGAGKVITQHDGQPSGGEFPTSFWRPGDHIADAHVVRLPSALPLGQYRLEYGLYDLQSLARLDVVSGQSDVSLQLP
jgi:hypothetical protein